MSIAASESCYYDDPDVCDGPPWLCLRCGYSYCENGHGHETDLGANVECVACERERVEDSAADG